MTYPFILAIYLCVSTGTSAPFLQECRVMMIPNQDKAMCERRLKTWHPDQTTIPHYWLGEGQAFEGEVIAAEPTCRRSPVAMSIPDITKKRWAAGVE